MQQPSELPDFINMLQIGALTRTDTTMNIKPDLAQVIISRLQPQTVDLRAPMLCDGFTTLLGALAGTNISHRNVDVSIIPAVAQEVLRKLMLLANIKRAMCLTPEGALMFAAMEATPDDLKAANEAVDRAKTKP